MNNLRLNVTIPSLSLLTPIGTNTYQVVVRFFKLDGTPLDNTNIPNSYTATVVTTSTSFPVDVPITDGVYSINDVVGKIYANNTTDCCFATSTFDIVNSGGSTPEEGARFEFVMGTTGGGFDPSATNGMDPSWEERIEAFNYSWGWGITGICLWIGWDSYEPTTGNYQTAGLQKVIDYCDARELGLSIAFLGKRSETDGFINPDEFVKGSGGTTYIEGVPGFGSVYAGYGCNRVNALMVGAIQDIVNTVKNYSRTLYVALAGGHTGELINHIIVEDGIWESGDFSTDNLNRFNTWCTNRGIASPGTPPMIQGPGIPWPHPDFTQARGVEFARFMSFNIAKYYNNFVDAVKAVSDLPCLYFYAAPSNLQLRATANANMNFIAEKGDGMYGSFGDGVSDHVAKFDVNCVNLGTFPDDISAVEFDPDDLSDWRASHGTTPPYCGANPHYEIFKTSAENLYLDGVRIIHTAMAFCPAEIVAWGPWLEPLHTSFIGKPYFRPTINSTNRIPVEVTTKYRNSEDLLTGIDAYTQYAQYTDNDYWGGVPPVDGPNYNGSSVTSYMDTNLAEYGGNALLNIRKQGIGSIYAYTQGSYNRDSQVSVASLSKSVTAVTILTLVEAGLFDDGINTTVGSLISTWNTGLYAGITLKNIIGHTSGIPDNTTWEGDATLEEYVDHLQSAALEFTPGSAFAYRTVSYQVAARMAEIVTGQTWKQIFESRVRNKCGMGNAEYNPLGPGPVFGNPNNPHAGYGLYVTQNEYSNFMQMICNGGKFQGVRTLKRSTLAQLWTDATGGLGPWGFGMIRNESGNEPTSESATGCYAWINRSKGFSAVLFTQDDYASTIGINNGLRSTVRATL